METIRCLRCGYHEPVDDTDEFDEEVDVCPECGSEDVYYSGDFTDSIIDESYEYDVEDDMDFDMNEEENLIEQ